MDTTSGNPSRIWKLPGTIARKGDNTADRPHRLAHIIEAPDSFDVVPREKLVALAAVAPKNKDKPKTISNIKGKGFDPVAFCKEHDIQVHHSKPFEGGTAAILERCIFNPDHRMSAVVIGWPDGRRAYRCQHNSCRSKRWTDVKSIVGMDESEDGSGKKSASTKIVEMVLEGGAELWHDPEEEPYITFSRNGHLEHHALKTKGVKLWMSSMSFKQDGKSPGSQATQDALAVIEGMALFEGEEHEVYVRVAPYEDKVYVDLGSDDWNYVEISRDGWKVVAESPVRFRRPKSMKPLPVPVPGGDWDKFRKLTNVKDGRDWIIIVGWLVQAYWPKGPYAFLNFTGEQGTGKTLIQTMLKSLVDPSQMALRRPPKDEKDLMIAGHNERIPSFDNISGVPPNLSDALCGFSTGVGFGTRELYTDSEETFLVAKRPCIMNGIDPLTQRGDLLDRTATVELPRIDKKDRKLEKKILAEFEMLRPQLLGLVLDATVTGMNRVDNVPETNWPRLADFCQ